MALFSSSLDDALQDFSEKFQELALTSNIPDIRKNLSHLVNEILETSVNPVAASSYILIDTDNDSIAEVFQVKNNNEDPGLASLLFTVNEQGEAITEGDLVGAPTGTRIRSRAVDGGSAIAFELVSDNNIIINGSKLFRIVSGVTERLALWNGLSAFGSADTELFTLKNEVGTTRVEVDLTNNRLHLVQGGEIVGGNNASKLSLVSTGQTILSNITAGSSLDLTTTGTVGYLSGVLDGASSIAHSFDTVNNLVTAGGRLFSVREAGSDVWYIDKDRNHVFNENQIQQVRLENLALDPSVGNIGRVWYDTALAHVKYETGALVKTLATLDDLDVENLWDRSGTNLLPHFPGDSVDLGVGSLTANGGVVTSGLVDGRDVSTDGAALDDLVTLTGITVNSTDLGTFTGTTIPDNSTVKAALQALETATEAENIWDRTGTTVTPHNIGDIIDMSGSDVMVSNLNAANNIRLDLNNTTALYQKDKTGALYHQVIYYDDDNNVRLGGVNMNQVGILNDKHYSGASNAIPLVPFIELAGVDTFNSAVFGDMNANTLKFKVGGLGGAVAAEILNGGNVFLAKQMKIGSAGGTVMGGEIDIVDAQVDPGSGTAGIGIASYRNADIWGSYVYGIRYRGTLAVPLACAVGDSLMEFGCLGWDGSAPVGGGELMWTVDGPVSAGVVPARADLYVTKLDGTFTLGLTVDSALKVTGYGDLETAGSFIGGHRKALAHNTYDLGENLVRFRDLYLQGNAVIAGTVDGRDVSDDGADGDDLITLTGVTANSVNLGIFTGVTIPDSSTIKAALQSLETEVELKANSIIVTEIDQNVDDLITLSGVAENATDLGTFTGVVIPDNSTIKAALQALETASEAENLWNRVLGVLVPNTTVNDPVDIGTGYFKGGHHRATAHNTYDLGEDLIRYRDIYYAGTLYGGNSPMRLSSKEANGASAVGFQFETSNALTTDGSSIFEIKNAVNKLVRFRRGNNLRGQADNTMIELYDKDGVRQKQTSAYFSGLQDQIQDFIVAPRHIYWHSNDFSEGANSESVFIDSNINAASATLELSAESLDGSSNFNGWSNIALDSSAAGGAQILMEAMDDTGDNVNILIMSDDQSALGLTTAKLVMSVNSIPIFAAADNGDFAIGGALIGGSSPFIIKSREANGALAVGFQLEPINPLIANGSKIINIRNNTESVAFLRAVTDTSQTELFVGVGGSGTQARGKLTVNGRSDLGEGFGSLGMWTQSGIPHLQLSSNSNQLKLISGLPDSVSAIAISMETNASYVTPGAKLWSLKNAGVEKFAIDKDGNLSGTGVFTITVQPSAGGAGILAALNIVAAAGGGVVQLLKGTYTLSASVSPTVGLNNVILRGVGDATVLNHDGSSGFAALNLAAQSITSSLLSVPATQDDMQVTFTTIANAGFVLAGDMIRIKGLGADTYTEIEHNEASANGDGGTGVVLLKYPIKRTITSPTATVYRGGKGLKLENFRLTSSTPFAASTGIQLGRTRYAQIENVLVDSFDVAYGMYLTEGWKNKINNCRLRDFAGTAYGIQTNSEIELTISNCSITNIYYQIRHVFNSNDCVIDNNLLTNGAFGLVVDALSGDTTRRIKCSNNKLSEFLDAGLFLAVIKDGLISDNMLDKCAYRQTGGDIFAIQINGGGSGSNRNISITGNVIRYARQGILLGLSSENCVISGNSLTDIVGAPVSAYGLAINAGGNSIIITNNTIRNCTKAGSTALGMYGITGSGNGNVVSNNIVDGCAGTGIYVGNDAGTGVGNVIIGNICRNITGSFGLQINNNIADSIIMGNNCLGEGISMGTGTGNDFIANKS